MVFGEDVAFGGVFRCTVGLRDKYGKLKPLSLYVKFLLLIICLVKHGNGQLPLLNCLYSGLEKQQQLRLASTHTQKKACEKNFAIKMCQCTCIYILLKMFHQSKSLEFILL